MRVCDEDDNDDGVIRGLARFCFCCCYFAVCAMLVCSSVQQLTETKELVDVGSCVCVCRP